MWGEAVLEFVTLVTDAVEKRWGLRWAWLIATTMIVALVGVLVLFLNWLGSQIQA